MTLRRSGVAQCSRSRMIVRPNRSRSSARFTRSPLSWPLRSVAGPPAPIRTLALDELGDTGGR